jgi:nickel transport protein
MRSLLALLLVLAASAANAHEVAHAVSREEAVVVSLRYGDGSPFAYEHFEVFPPGEEIPFATGRTDAEGRALFLPDRPGEWRVVAESEDGHGASLSVQVDAAGAVTAKTRSLWERSSRLIVGVALIVGLFGILALFTRRR